jgi:predicted RND superfamily exporter protein
MLALFYGSIPVQTRSMLVDDKFESSVIYIQMPFLAVDQTRVAVDAVNGAIDTAAAADPQQAIDVLHMAGVQTVTLAVNDLIIEGQIISLIVALTLTFFHIWLVFGDIKVAIITMMPVSVVSTLEPLILVLMDIPLSTVTVMIGSIAIGTGVDFAVQLTQRMRLDGYTQASVNGAVEKAGVSFVEATTTMVAGFAGMLVMNISSIQQFVLMIIILLVLNMVMAMFLFPALATIWIHRRKKVPPPEGLYVKIGHMIRAAMKPPRPMPVVEATTVAAESR